VFTGTGITPTLKATPEDLWKFDLVQQKHQSAFFAVNADVCQCRRNAARGLAKGAIGEGALSAINLDKGGFVSVIRCGMAIHKIEGGISVFL
jgi:hypothetical protein